MPRTALIACLALSAGHLVCAGPPDPVERDQLGRGVKLRILVDKVMQPTAGWVTEEWMVEATAKAGFNVFSPRRGHDQLDELRQVADWCRKHGIYFMPWMRGTLSAPAGPAADGQRLVWADGREQPLWSVNSDAFWEWTSRYITEYAKISLKNGHLMGVFLDYENYAPGKQGNLYYLSYDSTILGKFAAARDIQLPELAPEARKPWLENQGLHDAFAAFQIDHWRKRCRALREAVDRHNPKFQFCIYPAPGTPFMVEASYPEWATDQAPVILADASVYGRPSRFVSEQEALEINRKKLLERMEVPKQAGIPFLYAGGIDPVVRGADPEFSGKNAVMISEVTDGYWIFYEGPTYTKDDHAQYWKWFTWANAAICQQRFQMQQEPRQTPETWGLEGLEPGSGVLRLEAPAASGQMTELPPVRFRREALILLECRREQHAKVVLRHVPVAKYESPLGWEVRDPSMVPVAQGKIDRGETGEIDFLPKEDGLHFLLLRAGGNAFSLVRSNVAVGAYAGDSMNVIHGAKRLYFHVPAETNRFQVTVRGAGAETARLNVYNPHGKLAATTQTTPSESKATLTVRAADSAGGTWSLEVARADEGTLEDAGVKLDGNVAKVLSLVPEHVFEAKP